MTESGAFVIAGAVMFVVGVWLGATRNRRS